MMTVRFPNGQAVQYNDARFAMCEDGRTKIYTDREQKGLVAIVPPGCLIEWTQPCRVYNPIQPQIPAMIERELASLRRALRKALKK